MPYLDTYRVQIETVASDMIRRPVHIEKISAWWRGTEPVFRLEGVSILESREGASVLTVQSIEVNVGIFRSLWHRRLEVEYLTIDGVSMKAEQSMNGDVRVN